ncbi:protein of unknown function [Taphrina deformans PYCC 5710]|uniref:Uncharacterized protein n=1 Tax=Taphrina deformans (strain PYCC 5710 / ATCC 11124 / CBS 356.35 / IMI 108563 / JCM 9778 / NBRC 8474) TaxID=1097556 RepID=R4XKE1_TAPDE|nr:protein of unknown function [Taphrina deformans PYCC 5710]|eukprot:CCG83789.1 protein of unknown function [Taphrina deformans PYCC 5710]
MASFICSKCKLPISLSQDLSNPSKTALDLLRNAATTPHLPPTRKAYPAAREAYLRDALADSTGTVMDPAPREDQRETVANTVPGINVQESYIMLGDEQLAGSSPPHGAMSQALEQQRKLFDLLSKNSDVDHPLCSECTDLLIQNMNKKMTELERDRKTYISYLHKVKDGLPSAEEHELAEADLDDLKHQEKAALEDLRVAERERADVLAELAQLEKDSAALDEEERQFWQDRNTFAAEIAAFEQECDSINLRYDHDVKQLERLQKTNVYHDAFHIDHDGNFGTINGLRLGRLPNRPVSWDEINAAWGLTLLLLQTMAEKMDYTFVGYKLHPMGSTSKIDKLDPVTGGGEKVTTLELFGTTDINPLKLFQTNSFDRAVVAFLDCLRQLGGCAEAKDPTVVMPYKIVKDKIGEVCVRTSFNQDEAWTRALKFCLTNCKWILAVVQNSSRLQAASEANKALRT